MADGDGRAPDAFDRLLALQGADRGGGRGIPLEWAALQFRQRFPSLYYAPQWWQTPDGVIPYRRFWVEYQGMIGTLALERLNTAAAIGLAISGDEGMEARREARLQAFPTLDPEG